MLHYTGSDVQRLYKAFLSNLSFVQIWVGCRMSTLLDSSSIRRRGFWLLSILPFIWAKPGCLASLVGKRIMLEVLPKIAKMQASYALGKPLALPMNFTISVSYRCNSRCKTCNVWQRPNDDFTLVVLFKSEVIIGTLPYITGFPTTVTSITHSNR